MSKDASAFGTFTPTQMIGTVIMDIGMEDEFTFAVEMPALWSGFINEDVKRVFLLIYCRIRDIEKKKTTGVVVRKLLRNCNLDKRKKEKEHKYTRKNDRSFD